MKAEERVAYESRVRTRQVVIAAAAGILVMAAVLVQIAGPHVNVNEQTLGLVTASKRVGLDLTGAFLSALGSLALAWTLWYLWGCTKAREPNVRPTFVGYLAIAGGVIAALSAVGSAVASTVAAHKFVTHGLQTYPEANALLHRVWVVVPNVTVYLGALFVAVALVMVSLNAMRIGLLTRFLGYLGIIAGVLTIIPIVPIPIVEAYFLLALAYLFSGRWPSGVPPAWASGRSEPWPKTQRERPAREPLLGRGRGRPAPEPSPEPVGAQSPGSTRATTPKRKRKRRK
ncbi:MAG TPA: hypothetical protein VMJ65_27830 [Solirubrobacteraceae bacterium]|nr:hypothetical protein [Solirubrobacteraceae bacterium]